MNRWFRFYDDVLNDPKILMLPDTLFRVWVNILCIASKNNGLLPPLDEVAIGLRVPPIVAGEYISELTAKCLLGKGPGGLLMPHNWLKYQYKSDTSTYRVKRFRKRFSNVPETPPETDTEAEKKERKKDGASAPQSDEADIFRRAKIVLGTKYHGGVVTNLIKSKGNLALARSALETASTKSDPMEYLQAVIRGKKDEEKTQNDAAKKVSAEKKSAVVFATEVPGGIPGIT